MRVVWLAKRYYTHKDALRERYGRVYQLPLAWTAGNLAEARLELVDYYSAFTENIVDGQLRVASIPVRSIGALRKMARRLVAWQPDVIVSSGDCFLALLALRLARKLRARFVFDVYDDYRKFGAYHAFLGWDAYGYLLREADLVLYASEALAAQHTAPTPWQLVSNGIDPAVFRPQPQADARTLAGLANDGTRWIGYFGSMEPERGPEDLVEAVGLLQATDLPVRLVLCGQKHPATQFNKPWVEFRGNVDHVQIPAYINACDVVVLPYRRGPIIDMASSVKIAEYLHCRRPVVATETPNLLANFPKQARELGPAVCRPGDPHDLARALRLQLRRPTIASLPTGHAWTEIADTSIEALRSLTSKG